MAARCSADAPWRPLLNGCCRAGTNRSVSRPSASWATCPTIRCPWWTGSNEPPSRPIMDLAGAGRIGQAHSVVLGRVGVEAPDVAAGLLHVLLVPQLLVRLDQLHQRVGRDGGAGVGGDHILEVEDGGVVRLELEIVERRAVLLVREALLQVGD